MIDLSSLPKFIDGSGKYMWRLPDDWSPTEPEHVYVKLADVEKLLEAYELVRIPSRQVQDML